jgi:Lrp/AsnC family transcriptional regulator, leucine-responsive regulatory protein
MRKKKLSELPGSRVSIDRFDRRLLELVQEDNLRPLRQMAAEVNLSAPAVARRLQRLRAERVIVKDVVDPVQIRRPLTLIVEVSLHSELHGQLAALRRSFCACTAIQQCYYVTGEVDFVLIVSVEDMEEYEALTRALFLADENVRQFKTLVVMRRVKVDTHFPITAT